MTPHVVPGGSYIRVETGISIVINTVFTALFYGLIFGFADPVRLWGVGQWVLDFFPQSFMIALMSTLVPGLLTAHRLKTGKVAPISATSTLPRNIVLRAMLLALASAIVGTAAVAALAGLSGLQFLPAVAAFVAKLCYGAALAAFVTPLSLRVALAANPSRSGETM